LLLVLPVVSLSRNMVPVVELYNVYRPKVCYCIVEFNVPLEILWSHFGG